MFLDRNPLHLRFGCCLFAAGWVALGSTFFRTRMQHSGHRHCGKSGLAEKFPSPHFAFFLHVTLLYFLDELSGNHPFLLFVYLGQERGEVGILVDIVTGQPGRSKIRDPHAVRQQQVWLFV